MASIWLHCVSSFLFCSTSLCLSLSSDKTFSSRYAICPNRETILLYSFKLPPPGSILYSTIAVSNDLMGEVFLLDSSCVQFVIDFHFSLFKLSPIRFCFLQVEGKLVRLFLTSWWLRLIHAVMQLRYNEVDHKCWWICGVMISQWLISIVMYIHHRWVIDVKWGVVKLR